VHLAQTDPSSVDYQRWWCDFLARAVDIAEEAAKQLGEEPSEALRRAIDEARRALPPSSAG